MKMGPESPPWGPALISLGPPGRRAVIGIAPQSPQSPLFDQGVKRISEILPSREISNRKIRPRESGSMDPLGKNPLTKQPVAVPNDVTDGPFLPLVGTTYG